MANLKGKTWNLTGSFAPLFTPVEVHKNKKTGEVTRRIRLNGQNVQQRIQNFFQKYGDYIFIAMSIQFAQTAAKYTPPNIGNAYIDPSVMTYLIQAVAGVIIALGAAIGIYIRKARKKINEKLNIDENRNKEVESDDIVVSEEKE